MKVCEKCYTPRIDDSSIKWGDKYYCSLECFEGNNNDESNADIIERLKDEITDLEETKNGYIDDMDEAIYESSAHKEHLEHIYDKLNSVYGLYEEGEPDELSGTNKKRDDMISELIEYYNDEGVYNGR